MYETDCSFRYYRMLDIFLSILKFSDFLAVYYILERKQLCNWYQKVSMSILSITFIGINLGMFSYQFKTCNMCYNTDCTKYIYVFRTHKQLWDGFLKKLFCLAASPKSAMVATNLAPNFDLEDFLVHKSKDF